MLSFKQTLTLLLLITFTYPLFAQAKKDTATPANRNIIAIKPATNSDTAKLRINNINKGHRDQEKAIEQEYAKLIREVKMNIEELNDQINVLQKKIDSLKQNTKEIEADCSKSLSEPTRINIAVMDKKCKQKLENNNKLIQYNQEQIKKGKASIKKLQQEISQLEMQKQKALSEFKKQQ